MSKKFKYVCATCGEELIASGTGLKTWECPKHPKRFVTVPRDTSGGKEADKLRRETPITVTRHTLVKRKEKE